MFIFLTRSVLLWWYIFWFCTFISRFSFVTSIKHWVKVFLRLQNEWLALSPSFLSAVVFLIRSYWSLIVFFRIWLFVTVPLSESSKSRFCRSSSWIFAPLLSLCLCVLNLNRRLIFQYVFKELIFCLDFFSAVFFFFFSFDSWSFSIFFGFVNALSLLWFVLLFVCCFDASKYPNTYLVSSFLTHVPIWFWKQWGKEAG